MPSNAFNPMYLTLGLLGLCFVVLFYTARRFQREVAEDSTPTTPNELYGPLEQAYHAGLMREEEYLRIRERMMEFRPSKAPQGKKKAGSDDWTVIDPSVS